MITLNIYNDNDLLLYMCTYTLYNNIANNINNNSYLFVTKILMYYYHVFLLCYVSFCLLVSNNMCSSPTLNLNMQL